MDNKDEIRPAGRTYTDNHAWLQRLPDGRLAIGITEYGRDQLRDVAYIEAPDCIGDSDPDITIESSKVVHQLASPAHGAVDCIGIPEDVGNAPDLFPVVILAPGWKLAKDVRPMGEEAYARYIAELD